MKSVTGQSKFRASSNKLLDAHGQRLELLLRRQKEAWQAGRSLWVEELLVGIDLPKEKADLTYFLLELIDQEIRLRQAVGQKATLKDYQKRFPLLVRDLRNLWDQQDLVDSQIDREPYSSQLTSSTAHVSNAIISQSHCEENSSALSNGENTKDDSVNSNCLSRDSISRYEIRSELGRGSNGVVFEAWDPALKRTVALKRLRAGVDASKEQLDRIQSEAEAIARIHHPNIVSIYDVGQHEGVPFFAMEICKAGTLARRLLDGPIASRLAAKLLIGIANGVGAAHLHRVIHRDLKPGNVLIVDPVEMTPKVSDFGLAKKLDSDLSASSIGAIIGTPAYMSPEQAEGDVTRIGTTSDIYSMGAILYECLTGRPPFRGVTPFETLDHVRNYEPVTVRSLSPNVPTDLETITLKCLQKDPSHRYQSARELTEDLQRFLLYKPILARRTSSLEKAWRWGNRNRLMASLIVCISLLLVTFISTLIVSNAIVLRETKAKSRALFDKQRALNEREVAYAKSRASEELAKRSFYASQVNLACRAIVAGEVTRAEDLLNSVIPENLETDFRRFEWYLLDAAIHRNLQYEYQFEGGEVASISIAPDSKQFSVTGGNLLRGYCEFLSVDTGEKLFRLPGIPSIVNAGAYSPDGKFFALGCGDGSLIVLDTESFNTVYSTANLSLIRSVVWTGDSKRVIAGCENGDMYVWDKSNWNEPISMVGVHQGPIIRLRFSKNANHLYSISDWGNEGMISKSWDWKKTPFALEKDYPGISFNNETSKSTHALCSQWGTLKIVDLKSSSSIKHKDISPGSFISAESSGVNNVFFGAVRNDRIVQQINEDTLETVDSFPAHRSVSSIAHNKEGTLLIYGDAGGLVRVWSINRPPLRRSFASVGLTRAEFLPAGDKFVIGSKTENLFFNSQCEKLSDIPPGKHLRAMSDDGSTFVCLNRSKEATFDDIVEVWKQGSDSPLQIHLESPIFENAISISRSGRWIAIGAKGLPIEVYDLATSCKEPFYRWSTLCYCLSFSPNEELLVGGEKGGGVSCFHIPSATEKKRFGEWESFWAWHMSVAFSKDSSLVACGNESGMVHIWNTQTGKLLSTISGNHGPVNCLAFFPDSERIATGGLTDVRIWDIQTGQELMTIPIDDRTVKHLSINRTGESLLAASQSGKVYCWSSSGKKRKSLVPSPSINPRP